MNSPIRVAQILNNMDYGGVEAVIMNYYRNIDRSKIQFDFIINENSICPFQDEIEKLGGKIYKIPSLSKYLTYEKTLKKIFIENKYKIVHCHLSTLSVFPLRIAKKCNIPVRICHSHSTANPKEIVRSMIKYILRPFSKLYATDYFACGNFAGKWLFGKKITNNVHFYLMSNAIDTNKFKFNENIRDNLRAKLKINNDEIVIGHIGRFVQQKNHIFLIKMFKDLLKTNTNKKCKLLLIGDGPLKESMEKKVNKFKLQTKVIFIGNVTDSYIYYNCMDVFLLPSLYEGLPVVGIEGQCNGLPLICSNKMTNEILLTSNSTMLPLNKNMWLQAVLKTKETNRYLCNPTENYNICDASIQLCNKYLSLIGVKYD